MPFLLQKLMTIPQVSKKYEQKPVTCGFHLPFKENLLKNGSRRPLKGTALKGTGLASSTLCHLMLKVYIYFLSFAWLLSHGGDPVLLAIQKATVSSCQTTIITTVVDDSCVLIAARYLFVRFADADLGQHWISFRWRTR